MDKTFISNQAERSAGEREFCLLLGFIICFIFSASFFHTRSFTAPSIPPWMIRPRIEYFNGSLLWILSLACLLIAMEKAPNRRKASSWLAGCAALALLCLHKMFGFHERPGWFHGDTAKTALWIAAGGALIAIRLREDLPLQAAAALSAGWLFQGLHVLAEAGDGSLFRFPHLSLWNLKLCGEFLELFFLSSYLLGLLAIHLKLARGWRQARPGPLPMPFQAGWLHGFLFFFVLSALYFQGGSLVPPWTDGSPIDFFTSTLLWMLSLICMLIAAEHLPRRWMALFWLAACAGLALLAMDEVLAWHERSKKMIGDDDYIKAALWIMAGGTLCLVRRLEKPSPRVTGALAAGFLFQTLWLLTDIGDGDSYRLPFSMRTLQWTEEIFEILAMAIYVGGFLALYASVRMRCRLETGRIQPQLRNAEALEVPATIMELSRSENE